MESATTSDLNEHGQPVGRAVPGWSAPPRPPREPIVGRRCRLEPLDPDRHATPLHEAFAAEPDARAWTYLPYGPFASALAYREWLAAAAAGEDLFYAIVEPATGRPLGVASYLRIAPACASIEVGHLRYTRALQRTPAATEAMVLLMERAFALGYRRYEWKCDALNAPSRTAAERLGFRYEGTFRQALVVKGRNRDTAWFSIVDREWPALSEAYDAWLAPENFDAAGRQRRRLSELTLALRANSLS